MTDRDENPGDRRQPAGNSEMLTYSKVVDTNERFSIALTEPGEHAYFCVAMNLSVGRPVHCYSLDARAFASSIPSVVESVADGSLAYAEWTAPGGHFRIKRK